MPRLVSNLACTLCVVVGCAPDERPEELLPSCHEPIELIASPVATNDPLVQRACFDAPSCTVRDAFAVLDDIDPNVPGAQYACVVADLDECTYQGTPTNTPCWRVAVDITCTSTPDHLALEIWRTTPATTQTVGTCAAECTLVHQVGRCAPPDP